MADFIVLFIILIFVYNIYLKSQCRKLIDFNKEKTEVEKQIRATFIDLQHKNLSPMIYVASWFGLIISIILGFILGF